MGSTQKFVGQWLSKGLQLIAELLVREGLVMAKPELVLIGRLGGLKLGSTAVRSGLFEGHKRADEARGACTAE